MSSSKTQGHLTCGASRGAPNCMATEEAHRKQEARNWAFYRFLGGSSAVYCDWAVTAVFYAAVHRVEAFLIKKGVPGSGDHVARRDGLRQLRCFKAEKTLKKLETASREARYFCRTDFTPKDLRDIEAWADEDLAAELQ